MTPDLSPRRDVPLAPLTTLGVGGPADWFVEVRTVEALREACAWAGRKGLPLTVLGGGSNVVVSDAGVRGLVVRLAMDALEVHWSGSTCHVRAGAGLPWDTLVAASVVEGAWGIEALSGIPGSAGATPVQNVGAYGQEVSQTLAAVEVFDREGGAVHEWTAEACGFGYRDSRFRRDDRGRYIIVGVRFALSATRRHRVYPDVERVLGEGGEPDAVTPARVRAAVIGIRRDKGMVIEAGNPETRSVGSFFKNPVVPEAVAAARTPAGRILPPGFAAGPGRVKLPAAALIEAAGWPRGTVLGRARLSARHALAIVVAEGGRAEDVVELALAVRRAVLEQFGIALMPEPVFLGFGDDPRVHMLEATGR